MPEIKKTTPSVVNRIVNISETNRSLCSEPPTMQLIVVCVQKNAFSKQISKIVVQFNILIVQVYLRSLAAI